MNIAQCKQLLNDQLTKDPTLKNNISSLMTQAWGSNKSECMDTFGGISQIASFVGRHSAAPTKETQGSKTVIKVEKEEKNEDTIISQTEGSVPTKNETTKQETPTTETSEESSIVGFIDNIGTGTQKIGMRILYGVIGILILLFLKKLITYMLRRGYSFLNNRRFVYLKVMEPRGDGKLDRELQKEIAKDMKEKIGRMSQIFFNMHRLGRLTIWDKIMTFIFRKPKIVLMYHYENGKLGFIVGVLPEYQRVVEGAIGSQFPTSSIEVIERPKLFSKKYSEIMPLETQKDGLYTIKMYNRHSDDPINNIIDAMRNISVYDTATIIMPIKPMPEKWSDEAQKKVDRLYKNLDVKGSSRWKGLLPRNIIKFLINGKSQNKRNEENVTMVRMVKAKEETLNDMAKEAGTAAFEAGISLITSSNTKEHIDNNINSMISAYNVYTDEYGNELEHLGTKAGIFRFIAQPLWSLAASYNLTNLFYKSSVFTVNELSSLFHFPDGTYNRSNIIEWMSYKVLPAPDNLPKMSDENGFIISGIVAEKYKKGKVTDILKDDYSKHRAVGKKIVKEEVLVPIGKFTKKQLKDKEIIEKDGKQLVKTFKEKEVRGYKGYKEGILLGVNIYRNRYSPVYMKRDDRTRHHYCVGKSGTGKSVYLQTLARQDIWNGDGCCVIDPHGDLAEDMLEYIPKERAKDVIFFDAGQDERPMGLNLYEIESLDEADRTVNDATEIFIKMFGPEIFGPRIQEYFKYGSLTIMEDFEDRPTILDVVRLYTDEAYRKYKVGKVTNPVVKNFWEKTYNAMGDREKAEIIPYFSSKFVSFNTNRLIRNIVGQTKSAFNFSDVMDNRKILLISLSKGKIGELNAQLLGMILVSKIYNAAMARARMPQEQRKDFYLYVDEFQNFVSGTFADILSEARKYRLCLIMAHQYIAQLESGQKEGGKADVKSAVFGNVGTMQSFKVGAPDAEFLEKEYTPVLSAQDIVGIANYKAYVKLNINNTTTRPFSMNSIFTQDYKNKKLPPILKEYCAKKYGRKREFVDAEVQARLGMGIDEEPKEQTPQTNVQTDTNNTPQKGDNQEITNNQNPKIGQKEKQIEHMQEKLSPKKAPETQTSTPQQRRNNQQDTNRPIINPEDEIPDQQPQ